MTPELWQQIEQLFHQALEQPPAQRPAFLLEACDDASVRSEVATLLAAEADAEEQIHGAVGQALTWAAEEVPPEKIGHYRVLEKLGEGGLATVYLAERTDQYRMQVAIKLVKRGMDTAEILRRLRLERQILAGLDHVNVARLLDGGSTDDGRPYVVMEAIDGLPIDQHCDRHQLTIEQRLKIFRKVCSAVQEAHRSLVIHRDLKPSNILVTADGEPKLLDFGIAKLLDPQRSEQTAVQTMTGMRWLTPEYASPEQIRGEPLTTAADVYALGVLLCQLLCGRRPFSFTVREPREIERLVCESEPKKPSARLLEELSDGPRPQSIAQDRRLTVDRLRRRLEGDLDTIVGAALRKEPQRRYPSVQALDDDIRRHLESRPVNARPDTVGYRLSKFVRRNRGAVIAASIVLMSLLAGIVGVSRALWVAEQQRQRAEQHLQELEEVVSFNVDMFEIADPGEARGNSVTVREVLDSAAERVPRELGHRPAVASRLLSTLGLVYQALGLHGRAAQLLETSLELRQQVYSADQPEMAQGLHQLAGVRRDQRQLDEALELYRQALEIRREIFGDRHEEVAATLHGQAMVHVAASDWTAAQQVHTQALEMRRQIYGDEHVATADSVNDLGEVLFYQEQYEEAQPLFEQALDVRRRLLGSDHPAVAEALHNLAAVASELDRPQEAEARSREVLALRRELYSGPHRDVVRTLHNIALAIEDQGRLEEAEQFLSEALAMAEALEGGDSVEVGRELRALAKNLGNQGRLAEAEPLLRRGVELQRAQLGPEHPSMMRGLYGLARNLLAQGRSAEAISELTPQIELQQRSSDGPAAQLIYPLTLVAQAHADLGSCSAAIVSLRQALQLSPDLDASHVLAQRRSAIEQRCGSD